MRRKRRCLARIGAKLGVWHRFRTSSPLGLVLDGAVNKREPSIAKSRFDAGFLGAHTADFERGAPDGALRLSETYAILLT